MRKQARGHCGFGGKACSRRTQRGAGGAQGRVGGGATRLGEPTAIPARGAPSLARAPGRPRSPSRGSRAHSGGRGAGNGVRPARGGCRSNSRTTIPGEKNATKPRGRRTDLLPGTRSRTGCPLTSARRQGKARPLLFAPPRHSPFRGGRVSRSWAEDLTERRGKIGEQKEGKGGNGTSVLCFQKRRNLSEEKNLKRKRK